MRIYQPLMCYHIVVAAVVVVVVVPAPVPVLLVLPRDALFSTHKCGRML